jgi:hypothetical protein
MDKPTRFFINTEQLPGEVAGKLIAMGKQLLARFDLMREAGMVGDVWTQRTNDGIVFKLDKSGDVDNVKIFMPFEVVEKEKKKKEEELEVVILVLLVLLIDDNASKTDGFYVWDNIETDSASRLFIKEDEVALFDAEGYHTTIKYKEQDYKLEELELISTYSYGLNLTSEIVYDLYEDNEGLYPSLYHYIYNEYFTLNFVTDLGNIPWGGKTWSWYRDTEKTAVYSLNYVIQGLIPIDYYPMCRLALVTGNANYIEGSTYIFILREENWTRGPLTYEEARTATFHCERVYTLHYGNSIEGHVAIELLRLPDSVDYNETKHLVLHVPNIYKYGDKVLYSYSIWNEWDETYTYEYIYDGVRHISPIFAFGKEKYPDSTTYDIGKYHDFHGSTTDERAVKYGHEYWSAGSMRAALKTIPGSKNSITY